ncbi:nucleotide-binding protein [Nocardioides sp. NPDC126508]
MPHDSRSVFVVYGRNGQLRAAMFDFLRSINLTPMEWNHAVELTGKGAPYIGEILDAAFEYAQAIVVLLTPDEIAYLQPRFSTTDDPETQPAAQARPNVLFEAGLALGRNPDRTILVEVGDVRPFSDVAGRHAVRLNNTPASRQTLAHRLKTAGCEVNLNGTDWHTTGDFTAPDAPGDGLPLGRRVPSVRQSRPAVDLDVKYQRGTGNRLDKLQVINRGIETVYDVVLTVPDNAALDLRRADLPIAKIPGGGKSVTINAENHNRFFGGAAKVDVFDLGVVGRSESGEEVHCDVFMDLNG